MPCRVREMSVVLVFQCFNCEMEYDDKAAAKACCQMYRNYYKCLGCGEHFTVADRELATVHGLELMAKGFCGEASTA